MDAEDREMSTMQDNECNGATTLRRQEWGATSRLPRARGGHSIKKHVLHEGENVVATSLVKLYASQEDALWSRGAAP
jgi:hypothetical protein